MRCKLLLFLLCRTLLYCLCSEDVSTVDFPDLSSLPVSWDSTSNDYEIANTTTLATTEPAPENKTVIEYVNCETNEDCQELNIDTGTVKLICDPNMKVCLIVVIVEEKPTVLPNTTTVPRKTTAKSEIGVSPPNPHDNTTLALETTTTLPPPDQIIEAEAEFHSIPVVVWVLFTIPFISIIVLGIICGRRLKMQGENIQENLLRTTINGVHVDQLLSQRDLISTIALSRPPPTYEKATGEIPPSYETVLQCLQEKRQSIFQCDSLMSERDKELNIDTRSFGSSASSVRSYISNGNRSNRRAPIICAISRNELR